MARGKEAGSRVQVRFVEGTDFQSRHRRRTILTRMLRLGSRVRHAHRVLVDQVLGTRDAEHIEAALKALPLEVDGCFHFEVGVGAVFGVRLGDGRRVAVKVHQPRVERADLEAQHIEHALSVSGRRRLVTEARATLPDFAAELLQ
jgi:hypothetical protein